MPRKQKQRKIFSPPRIFGFKPVGYENSKSIELNLDELEAIQLLDYEDMKQHDVALHMNISRPTLTRIYERARKKIATAIVESKNISFKGGNIYYDENWFFCTQCEISFNSIENKNSCPFCKKGNNVISFHDHYKELENI
jgi:predicted DNA-binding protein (UPF0251 family)